MAEITNREHLLVLIKEALQRAALLGLPYESNLTPEFIQAQNTLETMPVLNSQQVLILAAARRRITQAERQTVALIIGDNPITGQQMSHLVRIRLICTELLNLLSSMLEQIQTTFSGSGFSSEKTA